MMNFKKIYIAHFLTTSVRKKRYIYLNPDCTCNYVIFINVPVVFLLLFKSSLWSIPVNTLSVSCQIMALRGTGYILHTYLCVNLWVAQVFEVS